MKKKILMLIILFLTVLVIGFIWDFNVIRYDNESEFSEAVDVTYSESEIAELKEDIIESKRLHSRRISYFQFKKKFKCQCVRKTFQGYYVVLQQDDGKRVFVFLNEKHQLEDVLIVEKFLEKTDFSFVTEGKTTMDEVDSFDSNFIRYPISAFDFSGHILKDGLLVIMYERVWKEGEFLASIVDNIQFYDNHILENELLTEDFLSEDSLVARTPYILPIDKK